MLFAIKLSYIRPADEIKAHLEAHKDWLVSHIRAGRILFAGPLQQGEGGYILGYGAQLAEIQDMLAGDPFDVHRLVNFDIQCCDPVIRAGDFPARWAADAKPV